MSGKPTEGDWVEFLQPKSGEQVHRGKVMGIEPGGVRIMKCDDVPDRTLIPHSKVLGWWPGNLRKLDGRRRRKWKTTRS